LYKTDTPLTVKCRGALSVCLILTKVGSYAFASSFCCCVFKREVLKHIIVNIARFNILKLYLLLVHTVPCSTCFTWFSK